MRTWTAWAALLGLVLTGCASGAQQPGGPGRLRTYFIAAEEVDWDYAPSGRDQITGRPFDQTKVFLQRGPGRIGSRYLKTLYRGFTDASFRIMTAARSAEGPPGVLGPVIRAEVGDTVRVVFRNRTGFPTSIHAHGVFYAQGASGAPYADGTSAADDAVAPGGTYVYTWKVPERAGPGPMDGSSIMWMYHSHVDEVRDTNTGLVGPIVVTRRGAARPDATAKDVDREVFALFSVINESELLPRAQRAALRPAAVRRPGGRGVRGVVPHALDQRDGVRQPAHNPDASG